MLDILSVAREATASKLLNTNITNPKLMTLSLLLRTEIQFLLELCESILVHI